ncbi:putative disease resistance RPP13-like protein 2 [Herrania umbratica]|uniref:Disease resistance RPP13-like protein 2 n=1 Tax=Herrania umbratica TaxID=108875 RepID=A0A6J1BMK6_9ROSI|nr:putative disease resistance RPP13-like protein 2 [Herrania umbratica]
MAFETTHILITKLNLIASDEANYPGLKSQVINNLIEELNHLQKVLESAENYQGSHKTIEDWDKLLYDIYSLEDDIETFLGRTMLQGHKVQRKRHTSTHFTSEVLSSNKIEQLVKNVRVYCKQFHPSPSRDSGVVQSQPTDSKDGQVPPAELIPPTKSSTDSEALQVSVDKETVPNVDIVVLTDLVKKLNQQLLSRLALQYLILTVDGAYLGRAILLWTVYNADDIKRHFQCRAWIRVSEELGQREIIQAILEQVADRKETGRLLLQSPLRSLHDFLVSKRYLIVLYGVQTAEFWDNIKAAFPYSLNGSRVITVVHGDKVARQINTWIVGRFYLSNFRKLEEKLLHGWPQSSAYLEEEYGFTGVKAAIEKFTQSILNPHILLFLISIKGSVGSGRTTLLWPIYNAKDVKQHFQCRAWVHVPQQFNETDILTNILEQVASVKLEKKQTVELLRKRLHNFLAQKRYLVVLNDVWTSKIWDNLKLSLPNSLNGSRVILTLSEGEANEEHKTNSSVSGMIPERELRNLKDVQEDVSDQKGAEPCDRLSDVKDKDPSTVGLDSKVKELAELTLNSSRLHFLITVLGVAGSGKTTLVKTIYNSVASKRYFKCRAWVSVPPKLDEFNERQLLIDLLGQLRNAKQKESLGLEQLREMLRLCLTWKRYLIVLDDISTPDAWERLNPGFPKLSYGSRVIITTRNPIKLDIVLKKVQIAKMMQIDINDSQLKDKILQRCRGLPLQIVLLGGLLSTKGKYDEWRSVIEHSFGIMETKKMVRVEDPKDPSGKSTSSETKEKIKRVMRTEHKTAGEVQKDLPNQSAWSATRQKEQRKLLTMATSREDQSNSSDKSTFSDEMPFLDIMALAYQDLAPPLRCCLLYLGLFPKSYEIPVRRLYQLWLAEGFVIPTDPMRSPEKLVEEYFEELKSRNMIEVTRLKLNGSAKTCRVPNTIYDSLFLDTEKVCFFHVSNGSGRWESPWSCVRRLAENLDISLQFEHIENRVRRLRSYISFCGKRGDIPTYGVKELLSKVVDGMLVVLDLEGVYKPALSDTLGKLPYLRYLGLRRTLLDDVPQSVGNLSHLETLDVKHTFITKLPSTIWKAKKLQHLYMSDIDVDMSTLKPSTCGSLNNLKILCGLVIRKVRPYNSWKKSLVGLRKLKLTCNDASNEIIAPWISQMDKLHSLNLRLLDKFNQPLELSVEDMRTWKRTSLSQLYLLAKLPKPIAATDFPENLEILTLSMTHLSEDPMETLGGLKQLKALRLYAQSFLGLKMTCYRGGFPKLGVLKLWMLHKLSCWTVQDGAMPLLRELEIRCCKNLKVPDGLEKLITLKELTLTNMKEDFVANVERSMGNNVAIMKKNFFSSSWE